MCGRYSLFTPAKSIAELFLLMDTPSWQPVYNIAPTRWAPCIRQFQEGRRAVPCRWGLVPFWAKDESIASRLINARSETAAEKPSFRAAFRHRRALAPMDGFFEWRLEGGKKTPYFIHAEDRRPLAAAALWESWSGPEGQELETFTILTTAADARVRPLHDRMPVFLSPEAHEAWLDPEEQRPRAVQRLIEQRDENFLSHHPVSTRVNHADAAGAGLIEPLVEPPHQPDQLELF